MDRARILPLILASAAMTASSAGWADTDPYVAGTTPWERPVGVPMITGVHHDAAWYQHALTGLEPPYPHSIRFLEDQGNWNTPFNRRGMPGRYDIRGWYTK
ncbi:MAG: hypothetical protein U9R74_00165 [Pseudomonadota bacterium]|nr:hypothetical protein [Pseudomonadota bacterium]